MDTQNKCCADGKSAIELVCVQSFPHKLSISMSPTHGNPCLVLQSSLRLFFWLLKQLENALSVYEIASF